MNTIEWNGSDKMGLDVNTKVLMHMNESTFKDELGHIVTKIGTPTLNTTIKKFKEGSARLSSTSCLNVNYSDTDYKTVDFWFNFITANQSWNFLFCLTGSLFGAYITTSNKMGLWYENGGATGTTSVTPGLWYHCAVTMDGSSIKLYLNGKLEVSATLGLPYGSGQLKINSWTDNSNLFGNCYIDEFRVSNIIRWTTNFTPNTTEYGTIFKYLIQDGTELKTMDSGNLVTVCNTTDDSSIIESAFMTSGLDDLSAWNNSLTGQIVNSTFKVAIYRKMVN